MLARTGAHCQTLSWKRELAAAYRDPRQLLSHLGLDEGLFATALAAGRGFSMLVPRCYAALMEPGNPDDPLLRQVLPTAEELIPTPGFSADPVGDQPARRGMGMLQKYRGRVLLIVTGACPIHCRYCFRRHYPYRGGTTAGDAGSEAWDLVRRDETIEEVIVSGGDPLTLDDGALAAIIGRIAAITHVRRIRIHTRLPIVLPSRVTPELSRLLAGTRLQVVMVVHANHPRELGTAASGALRRIASGGITLLNQSVLLRGVNDRPRILCELSEALFANGALPYYLHLLDRVQGAAHFEVAPARASRIARALRARLPGYLVPRIVREEAGLAYKAPVC